jgi:hypothetical protein
VAEHELKCWPESFDAVERGEKRFEFRRDDRGYDVGDVLVLRRWDPKTGDYTGRWLRKRVTYVMRGPRFGLPRGYCVMSIAPEGELGQVVEYSRLGVATNEMEASARAIRDDTLLTRLRSIIKENDCRFLSDFKALRRIAEVLDDYSYSRENQTPSPAK